MDITNKSRKPLIVPLPGGKRLFLAPGKTGQVSAKALDHPALATLIESGELETSAGAHRREGSTDEAGPHPGPGHASRIPRKQTGDL